MDFSKCKVAGTGIEEKTSKKEKTLPQYELKVSPYLGALVLIRVVDLREGGEVFRIQTNVSKQEYWIKRCKKEYKPIKYDKQRNNELQRLTDIH